MAAPKGNQPQIPERLFAYIGSSPFMSHIMNLKRKKKRKVNERHRSQRIFRRGIWHWLTHLERLKELQSGKINDMYYVWEDCAQESETSISLSYVLLILSGSIALPQAVRKLVLDLRYCTSITALPGVLSLKVDVMTLSIWSVSVLQSSYQKWDGITVAWIVLISQQEDIISFSFDVPAYAKRCNFEYSYITATALILRCRKHWWESIL